MAVFAGIDLKKWRTEQKMSAADLAECISCDASTIYRYESGKAKPDPDVAYQICEALGDISRWSVWMRTEYPISYARVHPEPAMYGLEGALMSFYAEVGEVAQLEQDALRDGADGKITNTELAAKLSSAITSLLRSAQRVQNILYMDAKRSE